MEGKLKKKIYSLFLFILFAVFLQDISGQTAVRIVPEHHEIRREYRSVIFGSNAAIERQRTVTEFCFFTGKNVRFQVMEREGSYYFIFINEKNTRYPFVSAGTYIIRRDKAGGEINQIKIFLNNDEDTFVRVSSSARGSLFELFVYGSRIYNNILIPASLESLVTEPFLRIKELSSYIVDWTLFTSHYNKTENMIVKNMAEQISAKLPFLQDSDDGAQDSSGNFVFIETLENNSDKGFNCSGFAKWVCDGLYYARENRLMDINDLKKKNLSIRKNTLSLIYEDERDPYFGLDWTRNIAFTLFNMEHPEAEPDITRIDIRNYPYDSYITDNGYNISSLKAILYYLTVTNPGYIYLGSVNGEFGTNPVLRQHFHVAVFLPYMDAEGNFYPRVFETNREINIDNFISRYPSHSIHLVRVKADNNFLLPDPEN